MQKWPWLQNCSYISNQNWMTRSSQCLKINQNVSFNNIGISASQIRGIFDDFQPLLRKSLKFHAAILMNIWIFSHIVRDRKLVVGFFLVRIPTSDSYFHLQYLPPIFYYCCKVSLLLCFYKDWEDDSINVTESNLKLVATVEWSFAHTSVYTIYLIRQGNNQKTNTCTCTLGKK